MADDSMISTPRTDVTPTVGPEAQLLLLQLLTQVKPVQHFMCNGSSDEVHTLRAVASDAVARKEDMKRKLESMERLNAVTMENLNTEIRELTEKIEKCYDYNMELERTLETKKNEAKELKETCVKIKIIQRKHMQKLYAGKSEYNRLFKAAKTGNVTDMAIILDSMYVNLEYQNPPGGWALLEWTVAHGHREVCHLLLERGANPQRIIETYIDDGTLSLVEQEKQWPLRLAARFGHLEIASLLIQYGAEVPNNEPELMAKERGYLKLAQLLCEWKGKEKCLYLVQTN